MAEKSKAELKTQISTLLADNSNGDISAADIRTVNDDAVDSLVAEQDTDFLKSKELNALIDTTTTLKIGDVAGGDYTEFEADGFAVAKGGAVAYRDEYPSQSWLPAGGKSAPDVADHTIGGIERRVYVFDGVATEEALSSCFEIPHDYMYGETIEVHMHFRPTTVDAGDVRFVFDWEHSGVNNSTVEGYNNPPSGQTQLVMVESVPSNKQYYHVVRAFGDLPDLGYKLGDKIGFTISRDPANAADTYPADVILEQVALHIPVDAKGSRERYVK